MQAFNSGLVCLLMLGSLLEVQSGNPNGDLIRQLQETAVNQISDGVHYLMFDNQNEILTKIEELSLLEKSGACSLQAKHEIKEIKAEANNLSQCIDIANILDQTQSLLANVTNVTLEITGAGGKIVSNLTDCLSTNPDLLACLSQALGNLDNSLQNSIISDLGTVVTEATTFILTTVQRVLGCLDVHKSLQHRVEYLITTKCRS